MADVASQAGDAYSCRAPGLISGLQGSMKIYSWCHSDSAFYRLIFDNTCTMI